jgi:uncharacterized protein (DUF427 family)
MEPPARTEPAPGQESVWDYPRPPVVRPDDRLVRVTFAGVTLAETWGAVRVLETSQAPAFYLPPSSVSWAHLVESPHRSFCEWKGQADYLSVVVDDRQVEDAAWRYLAPVPAFEMIEGYVAFYPQKVECWVDDERVAPMPGGFYGGWVTREIVGPFKGAPGSAHW